MLRELTKAPQESFSSCGVPISGEWTRQPKEMRKKNTTLPWYAGAAAECSNRGHHGLLGWEDEH